mgnify:CR=1 FL=1
MSSKILNNISYDTFVYNQDSLILEESTSLSFKESISDGNL